MRRPAWTFAAITLIACGPSTAEQDEGGPAEMPIEVRTEKNVPLPLVPVDDNVRHDTLFVQVTFDLGDGTFLMVARNVEETFEGLRLFRYHLLPDSAADVIAFSTPGYDSWTMLPTFFRMDSLDKGWTLLANFGEKQSWGQKVMRLDATGFHDLGFLDAALPERVTEGDTTELRRGNIAPLTRLRSAGDTLTITFATDSVYLYDDQAGHTDVILPAQDVQYRLVPGTLFLSVKGELHAVKPPA
ncbi:MAG: hypothetical protein H6595_08935 [Flavobacteriales bacterium]|nr:hypothetical protein [Flavobacteriales bacterium]